MGTEAAAKTLARIAHKGMTYGDKSYFDGHIMDVVRRVKSDKKSTYEAVTVAYLHDIVEDTDVTIDDLRALGFGSASIVDILTRKDGDTYFDYIKKISYHPTAARVKLHDLAANLAAGPSDSLKKRYLKALDILS